MPDTPHAYTRLVIRDLRLEMGIGVDASEQHIKQPVLVNLTAEVIPPADWRADSFENVVCYATLVRAIEGAAAHGHVRLVETFAEMIAEIALATPGILAVDVRVEKTAILPQTAAVGVEIRRLRAGASV